MVVVSPVNWNADVLLRVYPRLALRCNHDLILLVSHDSNRLVGKALHDGLWQGLVVLVRPKDLAVCMNVKVAG